MIIRSNDDAATEAKLEVKDAERDEGEIVIEKRFIGVVKGEEVELSQAAAGVVFAEDEVEIDRGGARDIVAGGPVKITRGGAGVILAAGDTSIRQGGAGTIVSLGRVSLEQSGAGTVVAGSASVGQGGIVLLALTPKLEVAAGGRAFGGPSAAVAAVIGIGIGLAIGRYLGAKRG